LEFINIPMCAPINTTTFMITSSRHPLLKLQYLHYG
jgi:hypothetical protein